MTEASTDQASTPAVEETSLALISTTLTEFDKVQAGLATLKAEYENVVFDVSTTKGMTEAKAARAAVRDPRYAVKRALDAAKKPLNDLKKNLGERAEYIFGQLLALEEPIDAQIQAEETRKEAERQAKIESERLRVDGHRAEVAKIGNLAASCVGAKSFTIAVAINDIKLIDTGERFEEFQPHAEAAKAEALAYLNDLHIKTLEYEQVQAEFEAERVALELQREEQRKAQAELDEQRRRWAAEAAEAAAAAQARLDEQRLRADAEAAAALASAQAEQQRALDEANAKARREAAERDQFMKSQQDAFEAEKRAAEALIAAERARLAEERRAIEAEHAERQRKIKEEADRAEAAKAAEQAERAAQAEALRIESLTVRADSLVQAVVTAMQVEREQAIEEILEVAEFLRFEVTA